MALDIIKTVIVIGGHLQDVPLFLEAATKARAAENCVGVVDAIVPAEYKGAAIVDEVYAAAFSTDYGDFDTEAAKVCAAYNANPPAGEAKAQKLLTIENLRSVVELIGLIATLFPRK